MCYSVWKVPTTGDAIALSADPLLLGFPFPLRKTFYPLGYAVEIRTNDPRILEIAEAGYGRYRARDTALEFRIDIGVKGKGGDLPKTAAFRQHDHIFSIVCDAENFAVCDVERGCGSAWLNESVVKQRGWVRYRFLESLIFTMLGHRYLTPLHAACVSRNGKGLLLSAPGGTGKTTLSYACARAGWDFLSDDASYLVREGTDRIVLGKPYLIRFVEDAAEIFPELGDCERFPDLKGDLRIELDTQGRGIRTAEQCRVERVVFLERSKEARTRVEAMGREEARERLMAEMIAYEEPAFEDQKKSLERLLEQEPCKLSYSDYRTAVEELEGLL